MTNLSCVALNQSTQDQTPVGLDLFNDYTVLQSSLANLNIQSHFLGQNIEKHKMNVHIKARPFNCRYGCAFAYNDYSNRNAHEHKKHGGLFTVVNPETQCTD